MLDKFLTGSVMSGFWIFLSCSTMSFPQFIKPSLGSLIRSFAIILSSLLFSFWVLYTFSFLKRKRIAILRLRPRLHLFSFLVFPLLPLQNRQTRRPFLRQPCL